MFEFIGLVFIVAVIGLLLRFVFKKHKAIVDYVPQRDVALLQRKTVLGAETELDVSKVIGVPAR